MTAQPDAREIIAVALGSREGWWERAGEILAALDAAGIVLCRRLRLGERQHNEPPYLPLSRDDTP